VTDDENGQFAIAPGHWMAVVRRADIDLERKGALLILGTYANFKDNPETGKVAGEDVHPGVDRYAQDLRRSEKTARRYLEWARELGVIELVRRGNRRKKLCDEYRLIMSIEAQERLGVPDPTAYKELIGEMARDRRSTAKAARVRRAAPASESESESESGSAEDPDGEDYRSSRVTANPPVDNPVYRSSMVTANAVPPGAVSNGHQRSSMVTANEAISGQTGAGLAVIHGDRPPYIEPPTISFLTDHEIVDLRADLTVSRARGPEDPNFPSDEKTSDEPAPLRAPPPPARPEPTAHDRSVAKLRPKVDTRPQYIRDLENRARQQHAEPPDAYQAARDQTRGITPRTGPALPACGRRNPGQRAGRPANAPALSGCPHRTPYARLNP
jgi:hypothetical protein